MHSNIENALISISIFHYKILNYTSNFNQFVTLSTYVTGFVTRFLSIKLFIIVTFSSIIEISINCNILGRVLIMTLFADTLKKYLETKNTTIYTISKISGVNRTMIQHMKVGKRMPANAADVSAIAKAMMLNPSETADLLRAYHISHMGEENYFRRENVSKIISSFYDMNAASELIIPTGMQDNLEMCEPLKAINGKANINRILKAILEIEANKKTGHIKIMVQPEYTYLFDCLTSIDFNRNQTLVEAIIVFDKNEGHKSTTYNLNILQKLVPILFQCEVFHPYYVYDNVDTLFNNTSMLPFKIITSDYVLAVSYEQDKAVLYNSPDMVVLTSDTFQKKFSVANPICHTFHPTPEEYLQASFMSDDEIQAEEVYELFYQPCFPSFCPENILMDRLNTAIIPKEMQQVIAAYFAKIRAQYSNHFISFTLEGLNLFMETGRVTEIPDFMYTYLKPQQRLILLKNIITSVDDGSFKPRIVRSDKLSVPSPLCICAPNEQKVIIYYFSPNKGQYIFHLQELSLVHAFHDFLVYLPESSMVYSEEESKKLLHSIYDKYTNIYC